MKIGDLVSRWDDGRAPIGVVLELLLRVDVGYIPAAKILINGRVKEYNVDDLWVFYESR